MKNAQRLVRLFLVARFTFLLVYLEKRMNNWNEHRTRKNNFTIYSPFGYTSLRSRSRIIIWRRPFILRSLSSRSASGRKIPSLSTGRKINFDSAHNSYPEGICRPRTYFTAGSSNLVSKLTDCGVIGGADEFKGVLDTTNGGEPSGDATDTAWCRKRALSTLPEELWPLLLPTQCVLFEQDSSVLRRFFFFFLSGTL